MLKDILEITFKEKKLLCVVCFQAEMFKREWLNEHFETFDQHKYSYNHSQSKLTDFSGNTFIVWAHNGDESLEKLQGQRFDRAIGLQNVNHNVRRFIQSKLKLQ
jgi:hypothetical protein